MNEQLLENLKKLIKLRTINKHRCHLQSNHQVGSSNRPEREWTYLRRTFDRWSTSTPNIHLFYNLYFCSQVTFIDIPIFLS